MSSGGINGSMLVTAFAIIDQTPDMTDRVEKDILVVGIDMGLTCTGAWAPLVLVTICQDVATSYQVV